jgi:cytochrome b involved in lipid metabolism
MGWMKAPHKNKESTESEQSSYLPPSPSESDGEGKLKHASDGADKIHIEDISSTPQRPKHSLSPPPSSKSAISPTGDLPFLSASAITTPHTKTPTSLYIVIDNIVYDCTSFVDEHPGGRQVIESFRSQDCSWQFWRFHSKDVMEEWGPRLRAARTEGVRNRWKERPRWVGLRRFGDGYEGW